MTAETEALVERLEADAQLPFCPYDRRSPEYWTTLDDKPCAVCGTENDATKPNKCNGTGSNILREAAARIRELEAQLAEAREVERSAVVSWFRFHAECVRADADAGLWEGIDDEVQSAIDEFNHYAESIERGDHLPPHPPHT